MLTALRKKEFAKVKVSYQNTVNLLTVKKHNVQIAHNLLNILAHVFNSN